ncbi:sensor histidine kinase [Saccharicrinis sp. FJH54]|uniref:sensor histidine kinase n=1 Tax=Saccharicrinis sp. FJH54 TaxID=3344665 RepID=UPI0035D42DBB
MYVLKLLISIVIFACGEVSFEIDSDNFRGNQHRNKMEIKGNDPRNLFAPDALNLKLFSNAGSAGLDQMNALAVERQRNKNIIVIQRWFVIFLSVFAVWLIFLLRTNLKSKKKIRRLYADLEQYNKKLEDLNRNKDKYLSIISHDLRAPLGSIKELLQIYIDEDDLPDKEQLKVLYAEVDHTNALLEDLLSWSKIQFDKQKLFYEEFRLQDIVSRVLNALMIIIHKKRIDLEVSVDPEIMVYADRNMVKMVLRNLISNALKFTRKDGKVSLSAYLTDDQKVCIVMQDTGVGIAADRLETIFDPARVVSTPGTENESGTGLGLVLCNEFIKLNHGSIRIDSEQGRGTTITVLLNSSEQKN